MNYIEFAKELLFSSELSAKLIEGKQLDFFPNLEQFELPHLPGRTNKIAFSNEQIKFPKKNSFHLNEKKALAMHFFANHELLAIEMMAAAILIYPNKTDEDMLFKKGLVKTIQDEQKHFKLYLNRMNDWGIDFGDFPINDFFWRQMQYLKTPTQFYSLMALTFESANLDFAKYYGSVFDACQDLKSASIMKVVYDDEVSHVALGVHWLNRWRENKNLWDYYMENLPALMTPARSKGIHFDKNSRLEAGLDLDFVDKLEKYYDDFGITNRKNW